MKACHGERKGWKRRYLLADTRLMLTFTTPEKDLPLVRTTMFANGSNSASGVNITVFVNSYLPTAPWQPVVRSLENAFRARWQDGVEIEHPITPPASKRAAGFPARRAHSRVSRDREPPQAWILRRILIAPARARAAGRMPSAVSCPALSQKIPGGQ